jgi:hypothetical protein
VHNEAITIPENIDAIRVLAGIEKGGSIYRDYRQFSCLR